SDTTALEAPLGYFALLAQGEGQPERLPGCLGQPFELDEPGLGIKQYPCCYGVHRSVKAVLDLVEAHHFGAADVRRLRVSTPPGELGPLIHDRPTTGLAGKFSMQYALAAALVDGEVSLSSFTDERVQRPEVTRLLPLIEPHGDPSLGPGMGDGHIEMTVE